MPFWDIYTTEMLVHVHREVSQECSSYITVKNWKRLKCPSTVKIDELEYILVT